MKLSDLLPTIPVSDRATVVERLNTLDAHAAVTKEFVRNLEDECRLDAAQWQEVVDTLVGAGAAPKDLQDALTGLFQRHTLAGTTILKPWPQVYGRAVTPDNFIQTLIKLGYAKTRRRAERFMNRLITGGFVVARKRLGRKYLAQYSMWSTFDRVTPDQDPFAAMCHDADVIRDRMGLEHPPGERLLVFVYTLPRRVDPHFPTVADAYAGHWNMRFRPAREGSPCGFTLAWERATPPHPEVVHRRILGRTLFMEVRLAPGS